MKKRIPVFVLVMAMFFSVFFGGCQAADDDEPGVSEDRADRVYRLEMATFWPAAAFQVSEGHTGWIEEIEQRTQGRVKINLHAGEALLGAREIYEGVATGVADIGVTCPAYTPGLFPLSAVFELPGYNNDNAMVASMTAHEGYRQFKEVLDIDEYDDVKVLHFFATGPGNLLTTEPVRNLDDLSGKSIRAVGGTVPSLELLGATPVPMPMSEAYLALDQRLVQGLLGPNEVLTAFRLAEVVDYLTETPFLYNVVFIKVMNLDTWNSLPSDIQSIIEEVSEKSVARYGQLLTDHTRAGLESAVEDHGLEVITLSSEEQDKWLERLNPIVEDWIEKTENSFLPGAKAFDIVRELDENFSEMYQDN